MKFDATKDFKTNSGLTVRIIAYVGNLGSEIDYPYYGYVRFKDGNFNCFYWDAAGKTAIDCEPFNLTEAINPDFEKSDLYDEFQNVWKEITRETFTESELLDLFMIKEKNLKDLNHNELKSAISALQKSEHSGAIALREKLQEQLDFMNAQTIKILENIELCLNVTPN